MVLRPLANPEKARLLIRAQPRPLRSASFQDSLVGVRSSWLVACLTSIHGVVLAQSPGRCPSLTSHNRLFSTTGKLAGKKTLSSPHVSSELDYWRRPSTEHRFGLSGMCHPTTAC